jgi:hypothetical protein
MKKSPSLADLTHADHQDRVRDHALRHTVAELARHVAILESLMLAFLERAPATDTIKAILKQTALSKAKLQAALDAATPPAASGPGGGQKEVPHG